MKNKIVYVLGAGFSKEAGFPLTKEFTNKKTISKFRKNINKSEQKRLDKVSKYFRNRIDNKYCKDDIESVLNHITVADYLDMESTLEGSRTYPSSQIFKDLLWYLARLLKERSKCKIPSEYYQFIKHVYENNYPVISFNYDLTIETILHELNVNCDYGVDETAIENSLLLMKIHGSVNWTFCTNCKQFVFYPDYQASKVLEKKSKCPTCKKSSLETIIIPPILYKDTFYKNPMYETLIRRLWGFANDELVTTNKVVFIGFSMSETDAYAEELFKLSSNMNSDVKYELVTRPKTAKKLNTLKKRYEQVLVGNKIKIIPKSFSIFAKKLN